MPDPAQADAELLAAAAVALNRHADVLRELGAVFADAGHELYLVGGSVRDALLGRLGNDLDFTTDARPEQMQRMLRGPGPMRCGTPGSNSAPSASARTATAWRSPPSAPTPTTRCRAIQVRFGDRLDDDLVRRDFTVNAMAVRITPDGPANSLIP